jgi:hypothetical protein
MLRRVGEKTKEGRDEYAPPRRKAMPGRRKPVGAESGDHQGGTQQSVGATEKEHKPRGGTKITTSGAPRGTRGR